MNDRKFFPLYYWTCFLSGNVCQIASNIENLPIFSWKSIWSKWHRAIYKAHWNSWSKQSYLWHANWNCDRPMFILLNLICENQSARLIGMHSRAEVELATEFQTSWRRHSLNTSTLFMILVYFERPLLLTGPFVSSLFDRTVIVANYSSSLVTLRRRFRIVRSTIMAYYACTRILFGQLLWQYVSPVLWDGDLTREWATRCGVRRQCAFSTITPTSWNRRGGATHTVAISWSAGRKCSQIFAKFCGRTWTQTLQPRLPQHNFEFPDFPSQNFHFPKKFFKL